jgi:hypothetical protein
VAINTPDDAKALAEKLMDELIANADADMLSQARESGMVLSLFYDQVEEARQKYQTEVDADLEGRDDIFETAVTSKL